MTPARLVLAAAAVVTFAGSVVVASRGADAAEGAAVSTTTVRRETLTAQVTADATLGYHGSWTVLAAGSGTVTWLPAVGAVVGRGRPQYALDGAPVVLLTGSLPLYRAVSQGMSGADVREVSANLVALGLLPAASSTWTWSMTEAVTVLQGRLGVPKTGRLDLGAAVVQPGPVRVTGLTALLGAAVQAGATVLTGSSTTREVAIALDSARQRSVRTGDRVTITLPDQTTTPGTVTSVGTVATKPSGNDSSDSSPTVEVLVAPTDPRATGALDAAPVEVAITTDSVAAATVVPVAALLALAGGGYAVEVVDATGTHRLVGVQLGLFDDTDGLVQVTGSVSAGQRVVVPST